MGWVRRTEVPAVVVPQPHGHRGFPTEHLGLALDQVRLMGSCVSLRVWEAGIWVCDRGCSSDGSTGSCERGESRSAGLCCSHSASFPRCEVLAPCCFTLIPLCHQPAGFWGYLWLMCFPPSSIPLRAQTPARSHLWRWSFVLCDSPRSNKCDPLIGSLPASPVNFLDIFKC